MKINLLFTALFLITVRFTAFTQSVYQLQYKLPAAHDTNTRHAFFVRYNDGTGLIRLKYVSPLNGDSMLVQLNVQEQYPDLNDINTDNNKIFYKLLKPAFLKGTDSANYSPPIICFQKDTLTALFEPLGIIAADEFAKTNTTTFEVIKTTGSNSTSEGAAKKIFPFISVEYIESKDLTKIFVSRYFSRNDDFYKNLFLPTAARGNLTDPNTKLILLTVANIKDSIIGGSCLKDMNRMVLTFRELTAFLGIKFEYKTISGNDYNKKNVEDAIKAITPNPNDIVVFYYSGHGFRKLKDKRRFPYIDLRPKPDNTYMINSLNMDDIFSSIKKKGARFNLVLSDCCNTEVGETNAVSEPIPDKRGPGMTWNPDNCMALFLNPEPVSILATAADEGQRATSNNKFGGFFSYFFKMSVESYFSYFKKDVTWDQILGDIKIQTADKAEHTYCDKPYIPENICLQYPYFKIQKGRF